ncbi:MAG: DUF6352 family protein [Paracoccus sp. (in: a-proteobacteria)]|nr:DUF6352 family protein [Paracoccus sp. (in: a-proteobacteria)]
MPEFWVASGHHLTRLDAEGRMQVTDELLLAWLARPELAPPEDACAAERAIFARLRENPRAKADPAEITDPDGRENWAMFLELRDRLLAAPDLETATRDILENPGQVPPIFRDQLIQLVLRNALNGCTDPFTLRAGELYFRPQRGHLSNGSLMLADAETVEEIEAAMHQNPLGAMLSGGVEGLDVMRPDTGWSYWSRSDAHTMVLPWGAEPAARQGFADATGALLRQLTGLRARIRPVTQTGEVALRYYIGLNAEGSEIGNALWHGHAAPAELVGLFALEPEAGRLDPALEARLEGGPVWLLLGMGPDRLIRLKPQNLVAGLPLRGQNRRQDDTRGGAPCRAS